MSERLATLARRLVEKRTRRDETKRIAELADRAYRDEEQAFWDRMDDEELETQTFDLGEPYGRVQFQKRATRRARVLDKARLVAALRELGRDAELVDDVALRGKPLNDFVRTLLDSEEEFPAGLDFNTTRSIHISHK